MARPRTVSDAEILEAARTIFLAQGGSASTSAIAEEVGLSQAALFKRFGTKRDLMLAALKPPAQPDFVTLLGEGPDPDRSTRDQVAELAESALRYFRQLVPRMVVLTSSGLGPEDVIASFEEAPPLVAQRRLAEWLEVAMEQGRVRRGDAFAVANLILAPMHMRAFSAHLLRAPLDDDAARAWVATVVGSLWAGLAPDSPEDSP